MGFDETINILMQNIENTPTTFISKFIAVALDPIILSIISVLIAAFLFYKGKKKQSIFFVLVMGVAGILIKVLKMAFGRARPLNALVIESSESFPSGHATIAVVFFGALAFLLIRELKFRKKKKGIDWKKIFIIKITAFMILISGLSRVYLRVHWPTDVIAGFALGTIILTLGIILYKKL